MQFLRKKRLFILLIGMILLVALIGYSLRDRDKLSVPERFINDTVGWAQAVIHKPIKYVSDIFLNLRDMKDTYKENQILKEKLGEYKGLIYEAQELKKENEELQSLLDKSESMRDYNPIQATVIARSPERWMDQVTINKGKKNGVKPNMAVITSEGMIGKIQTTSDFTSTVQLLTGFDQFNRISATISRSTDKNKKAKNIFGLIEEYDKKTNSLLFRIIEESEKDIKKGELVVSSGLGGVFPSGLPIGKIKDIVPDQYSLTKTALVEPAANMYEIKNVIVVARTLPDPNDDIQEEDKK